MACIVITSVTNYSAVNLLDRQFLVLLGNISHLVRHISTEVYVCIFIRKISYIVTCLVTRLGVWIGNWIYWVLTNSTTSNYSRFTSLHTLQQIVTTSNYSRFTNLHNLQFTLARTKTSQFYTSSLAVAWGRLPTL
jgi:hypothetical protein